MPDMKMVEVRPEQVDELAALAKPIWTDHFTPIIGAEQTAYMIEQPVPQQNLCRKVLPPQGTCFFRNCIYGGFVPPRGLTEDLAYSQ